MTVLVVMNGVGRFLVPDVGTGDRVDDEAEDVELHHTRSVDATDCNIQLINGLAETSQKQKVNQNKTTPNTGKQRVSYLSRDGRWPLRRILSNSIYLFKCSKGFKNEGLAHTNVVKT